MVVDSIPVIDLALETSTLCHLIVKTCQDLGFFMVKNHGISSEIISRVERQGQEFFAKPTCEKQRAIASPLGYGCKTIGCNGDEGDLEYILLEVDPQSISTRANFISDHPVKFSFEVNDYIQAVRKLACQILDMIAVGLNLTNKSILTTLILHPKTDSYFRINHYPLNTTTSSSKIRIGFGEHSDPQILTILRSNDVPGLQIQSCDGLWIPVPPDPDKLCVFVGDALQALTNGRFVGVRHRALASNSSKERMSIMYFAAPALDASIAPIPDLVSRDNMSMYRCFTWREFKATAYSLRLAHNRLNLFKNN